MLEAVLLSPDVRFEGFTTEDWVRFLRLWQPRAAPEKERDRPRGGVVFIHEDGEVLKLLHTHRGRLDPAVAATPSGPSDTRALALRSGQPSALGELARLHHASWALGAQLGALDEVMERLGAAVRRGDDLTVQTVALLSIVRDMIGEGKIATWPQRLRGVPVPAAPVVRRTFDALCGDGKAIALGLFDSGEVWTAFVARRRGPHFDLIAGPEELRGRLGLLSGDWRRDYRHLGAAVEDKYAPLGFGCFAELKTFRALQTDPSPGAWSRSIAIREVIVAPMPLAVGIGIGFDGMRYAMKGLRVLTERVGPLQALGPMIGAARAQVATLTGKDVGGLLGFDPMAVLRALLER
jgi:hypothetical protein